jgi:hypothetical protein
MRVPSTRKSNQQPPVTYMKLKTLSLAALAAFTLVGAANAANIIWSTPQAISSSTDVNTQGTLFTAKSTGYNSYTVNGVLFDTNAANISEAFVVGGQGGGGFMGGQSYIGSNDAQGQAYAGLMDFAHGNSDWGANPITITFTGLSIDQEYLIQYWVADYRTPSWANPDRTLTLTGGANTSDVLRYMDADNTYGIHGSYVIGTFKADAASQSIIANSNASTMMQAAQLRAIPEPSAALIGGLGMLALLRRRRA